jgi:hypothetical protein
MSNQPAWETPAHLFGLPLKSWKRKSDIEMRGTLAECVKRFLNLPQHHQQNCTLTMDNVSGRSGPASIRRMSRFMACRRRWAGSRPPT